MPHKLISSEVLSASKPHILVACVKVPRSLGEFLRLTGDGWGVVLPVSAIIDTGKCLGGLRIILDGPFFGLVLTENSASPYPQL